MSGGAGYEVPVAVAPSSDGEAVGTSLRARMAGAALPEVQSDPG